MTPLVFRTARVLVWLLAGMALLFVLPALMALLGVRDGDGQPMPVALAVICLLFSMVLGTVAFWIGRTYIAIDDSGLRWRELGPEHQAGWEEITDYFIRMTPHGQRTYVVKTTHGRQLSFDTSLSRYKSLAQHIALHATQASAKGWLIQSKAGTLSEKHVFAYSAKAYRSFLWQQLALPIFPLAIVALLLAFPETRSYWFQWVLFTLAFFGTSLWAWRGIQEAQKYRGSRLEVDEHTLTFVRPNGDEQTIRWSEIVRIEVQVPGLSRRFELRTKDAQFYVHEYMEQGSLFRALLQHYCPVILSQNAPTGDALLSTEKTNGRRVFHYQTRTNRRMLGMLLGCAFIPLGVTSLPYVSPGLPLTLSVLLVAGWGWALWRYRSTYLVLDAEGITQKDLRGTTRVSYEAITRLGASEWFYVETADSKCPIRWSPSIADAEQLRQELETRTGLAFNRETALSPELIQKVQNPAEEADQVQQQLERSHSGR